MPDYPDLKVQLKKLSYVLSEQFDADMNDVFRRIMEVQERTDEAFGYLRDFAVPSYSLGMAFGDAMSNIARQAARDVDRHNVFMRDIMLHTSKTIAAMSGIHDRSNDPVVINLAI